jgi:hypothetical protein
MNEIPSGKETLAMLRQMVKDGLMEELTPGNFSLTEAGRAYAAGLAKTQQGAAIMQKLAKGGKPKRPTRH